MEDLNGMSALFASSFPDDPRVWKRRKSEYRNSVGKVNVVMIQAGLDPINPSSGIPEEHPEASASHVGEKGTAGVTKATPKAPPKVPPKVAVKKPTTGATQTTLNASSAPIPKVAPKSPKKVPPPKVMYGLLAEVNYGYSTGWCASSCLYLPSRL